MNLVNNLRIAFQQSNPDYPFSTTSLKIESCTVSDTDIPSGNGGINSEGYSYGQLRHHPIIPVLMSNVENIRLRQYAEVCNARNEEEGFLMFKVDGEYCFWKLRIGPVVKAPTVSEMKKLLLANPKTAEAVKKKNVSAGMIREVTYTLLRQELARCCGISDKEAALAIGNQLDCAPHEDVSGYIFMVPNWAHKWFRHDGYVASMLRELY